MLQSTRASRSRFILLLVCATALSLLTLDFRGFGPLETAQRGLRGVLEPLVGAADSAFSPARNAWRGVVDYQDVKRENDALRAEIEALKAAPLQDQNVRQQLDQLKAQLDIATVRNVDSRIARVISGPVANFENTVRIDKGSSSGIAPRMVVVTEAGLVGRVVDVTSGQAVVELADSLDFGVGVRPASAATPTNFVLRGQGPDRPLAVQGSLDPGAVSVGDAVVTSGLDGSVFPPDILVGTVTNVPSPTSTLATEAAVSGVEVTLAVDPSSLWTVSVLLWQPNP